MKKLFLLITATIFVVATMNAQNAGLFPGKKETVLAPDVNATIVQNVPSGSKDGVYNPDDSPAPDTYDYNTYTELGWTEIIVSETDIVGVVTIDYTWATDDFWWESSFYLESPGGTSVVFASKESLGTYSVSMTDFFGETMDGTWILWIEDSYGDGGHQATDIMLTFRTVLDHDLGVTGILPIYVPSGESSVPQVEIYNFGTNDETIYEVNLSDGNAYNETVNITTTLVSNSLAVIDFPEWFPSDGVYSLTATVTLSDDENPANDVYVGTCYIGSGVGVYPTETAYAYSALNGNNPDCVLQIPTATGDVNPLLETGLGGNPFVCAEYMNGAVYAIAWLTNNVYVVLADGNLVQVGTISGILPEFNVFGLAYDHINDVLYACAIKNGITDSYFYTVDDSWNCTLVGNMGYSKFMGLTIDKTGNLYGIDLYSDHFFSIDKATGIPTDIGAFGYNLNNVGDLACDTVNNVIYGVIWDLDNEVGHFGTFDVSTGAFTNINPDLGGYVSMCAVIPGFSVTVQEFTSEGISIYPNPSKGVFNVCVEENYNLEVFDITGRVIYTQVLSWNSTVKIKTAGVYFFRFSNDEGSVTQRIVVQ